VKAANVKNGSGFVTHSPTAMAARDDRGVPGARGAFRISSRKQFRSRSSRRFPCGTPGCCRGFGIVKDYLGAVWARAEAGQGSRRAPTLLTGGAMAARDERRGHRRGGGHRRLLYRSTLAQEVGGANVVATSG